MWLETKHNSLLEPRLIGAIIGAVLILGSVGLVTLGIQRWQWFERPSELDQVVPSDAAIYLRFDIRKSALAWWESASVRERWTPLLTEMEKGLRQQLGLADGYTELLQEIAGEIAYVQYDANDPRSQALLIRAHSSERLAEKMSTAVAAEYANGGWTSRENVDLFGWLQQWLGGEIVQAGPLHWEILSKHVLIVSLDPRVKESLSAARDRKTETMRDRFDPFQPGKGILHGFLPLRRMLPEPGLNLIQDRIEYSDDAIVFAEIKTDGRELYGRIQEKPQSLLTRLTLGDAAGGYSESLVTFPASVRNALVNVVPQELQQSAAELLTEGDEQLDWSAFVKQEFGLDWDTNVLPILDLPADVILGESTETVAKPFVIVLQAENPATAELRFNNIEAMIRQVAAHLFPREVEKVLPDGSIGIELLPDPQTPRLGDWAGNLEGEHFLDLNLSEKSSLVFGRFNDRILISNSAGMLRSSLSGEGARIAELMPQCISELRGREVYLFSLFSEASDNFLRRFFSRAWIGDSSDNEGASLSFCLPLLP